MLLFGVIVWWVICRSIQNICVGAADGLTCRFAGLMACPRLVGAILPLSGLMSCVLPLLRSMVGTQLQLTTSRGAEPDVHGVLQQRSPGCGAEKRHRAGMVGSCKYIALLAHISRIPVLLWQNAVGGGAVVGWRPCVVWPWILIWTWSLEMGSHAPGLRQRCQLDTVA
jgi:hypothetical protein